jgi:hypothetical protein
MNALEESNKIAAADSFSHFLTVTDWFKSYADRRTKILRKNNIISRAYSSVLEMLSLMS